jgi:PKD repeat protein
MENFEDIIKQKVEQFEPKFNEAHWNALDQKLTSIKIAKIRRNILLSIAAILVVAIGGFSIYQNTNLKPETSNLKPETSNTSVEENTSTPISQLIEEQMNNSPEKKTTLPVLMSDENKLEKTSIAIDETSIQKTDTKTPNTLKESTESVVIDNQLTAGFIVYNNKICLGEEVSFEATDKQELLAYTWDFGDGNASTKSNPKYIYKQQGTYSVKLTVVNKRTNQEKSSIQKNVVIINPLPTVDFTYLEQSTQFDDNALKYPYTNFTCKGESTDSYEWNVGNSKPLKEKQPKVLFDKKGDYQVALKAKSALGCFNSTTKTVSIQNSFELFAPNAFTPNFDDKNDDFMPEALSTWDIKFEMVIKNKSGQVIFTTTDKNNAWKGSLNNQGSILDEGLYFWQVVTYDVDNKPYQHAGKINLIK